jgi:hypothetical protein
MTADLGGSATAVLMTGPGPVAVLELSRVVSVAPPAQTRF